MSDIRGLSSNSEFSPIAISTCPMCRGPAIETNTGTMETGDITSYEATITPTQIALALDNEATARAAIALMPAELRRALVTALLGPMPGDRDGYFTIKDVEDEAEAGLRSFDVAKQLSARSRHEDAAHFRGLSERHQRRALKITGLLTESEQLLIKQRVHGGPVGNQVPAHIEIVKS